VLKGADGIMFVADSQDFALDANLESLQNLEDNLKRQGIRLREMPLVIQYNKRDLSNALPVEEMDAEVNKLHVPRFESVATSGLGVEETLKGITQLVLAHLVKKYGLEGSEPLDKEIQILNAPTAHPEAVSDSLWDDDETASPAPAPRAAAVAAAAPQPVAPHGEQEFDLDESSDESVPMVATELVKPAATNPTMNPFEDVTDYFSTPGPAAGPLPTEVPMASIEIPLPKGILDSLPVLESQPSAPAAVASRAAERRATDGLVKEISIPLNLSMDEIREHRRLRLKITLDVNLLP
jgi:hypothetical protein